jgi:hypothetical protein
MAAVSSSAVIFSIVLLADVLPYGPLVLSVQTFAVRCDAQAVIGSAVLELALIWKQTGPATATSNDSLLKIFCLRRKKRKYRRSHFCPLSLEKHRKAD